MRKHLWKRNHVLRKRKNIILIVFFCINIGLLTQIYTNLRVYPGTWLGNENISGKTPSDIDNLIRAYALLPYQIQIRDRMYTYVLTDMGVFIDTQGAKSLIFSPNRKPFPMNFIALAASIFSVRRLSVPVIFTKDFQKFVDQSIYDFSKGSDDVRFDETSKILEYVQNENQYRLDELYFKTLISEKAGNNTLPLYPQLIKIADKKAEIAEYTAKQITNIYLSPLLLFVPTKNEPVQIILSEKELRDMVNIQISDDLTRVSVDVSEEAATRIINKHVSAAKIIPKGNYVTPKVKEDLKNIFNSRFLGHDIDALTIELDKGPNTTGSYAQKYIEIDISQQQMYLFQNGKLVSTHRVSTGKDYQTPTGEFKILNKSGLGYSAIYHVWMPYWMAFGYSNKLRAYFGIHELPYTITNGYKVQRPREFIGTPNTGGCVALDIGIAKLVYAFADIGTPVVIYN